MADDRPVVYAKGVCPEEGGVGGCAAVVAVDGETIEISEGYEKTTVNRMSMRALILGLSALPRRCPVVVYTDSRHIADVVNGGWIRGWRANGWRGSGRAPLKNVDLWRNVDWALGESAELRHIERDLPCADLVRAGVLALTAMSGDLLSDGQYVSDAHAAGRRPEGVSAFDEDAPAHAFS